MKRLYQTIQNMDMFQKKLYTKRRLSGTLVGLLIISLGQALFRQSQMGNDAGTSFVLISSELSGISLGLASLIICITFLVIEFFFGRRYVGLGTVIHACIGGYLLGFWLMLFRQIFEIPHIFTTRMVWLILGVVVASLGVSLYQTANLGIAGYDFVPIGIANKMHVPYFIIRVLYDGLFATLVFFLGGKVGIGTVVCALCLGPFVTFFDHAVSEKLIYSKKEKI